MGNVKKCNFWNYDIEFTSIDIIENYYNYLGVTFYSQNKVFWQHRVQKLCPVYCLT